MVTSTGYGYGVINENEIASDVNPQQYFDYGSLDRLSASITNSYTRLDSEGLGFENEYDVNTMSGSISTAASVQENPVGGFSDYSEFYDSYGTDQRENGPMNPYPDSEWVSSGGVMNDSYNDSSGLASTPLVAWNLINLLLSTSLLAFPFIVREAGYIVFPIMIVIAIVMNYTSQILVSMMYERPPRAFNNQKVRVRKHYSDLGRVVFNSEKGEKIIQVIQIIEMLSICILNICVLGQLGEEITNYNVQTCTAIAALFALPTFFIRKLAIIGWLQTIGVVSLTIGLLLIQGWCIAHADKYDPTKIPVARYEKIPVAIGVIIYAYGIQGVLPGMEEQMRKPKRFGFVVNCTFTTTFIVQFMFSLTNAMYYGEYTAQVIVIDLRDHFELGITSACFIGISILSHFSLPTFVVMDSLDNAILSFSSACCPSREHTLRTLLMVVLRIGVIGLSLGVAIVLPYFAYLTGLIGSSITLLMCLVLPCVFHLKLRGDSMQWCEKVIDVIIIVCSLMCLGAGTYFSFESIYYDIIQHSYD